LEDAVSKGTPNTPVRLTQADREKISAVQERYGLPSLAATLRFSLETVYRMMPPVAPKKTLEKSDLPH
jgi:hypothetical protein